MEGKKKTVTVVISEEGNWNPRSHIGRNFGWFFVLFCFVLFCCHCTFWYHVSLIKCVLPFQVNKYKGNIYY
jgi:hypothetical protein